jgi:class 3 adenylate cyclase
LLETVYDAFDQIAAAKSVFKVETIGDCYVAAAGIPKPQKDHAVIMATFSRRCLDKFLSLVGEMDESLGPGTSDLGMRFGLHSGPIIGGILRGAKVRTNEIPPGFDPIPSFVSTHRLCIPITFRHDTNCLATP